ncbi:MAG: hypothetical protein D6714_11965 [Bacteroidetes bacterium]|nr:MAG: hypothetical protein D6714_11965 [Bacteroidota bacterium]
MHHESLEWLDTIAFWKDEMKFFDKLLHMSEPIEANLKRHRQLLEDLENLQKDLYDQLEQDVIDHEKLLARLLKAERGYADQDYREKHRRLKNRMETMMNDFKTFKRTVFEYVKSL